MAMTKEQKAFMSGPRVRLYIRNARNNFKTIAYGSQHGGCVYITSKSAERIWEKLNGQLGDRLLVDVWQVNHVDTDGGVTRLNW
jgi:hypothetical protein